MLISVQQKGLLAADDSVNEEGDASKIKELFPTSEKNKIFAVGCYSIQKYRSFPGYQLFQSSPRHGQMCLCKPTVKWILRSS